MAVKLAKAQAQCRLCGKTTILEFLSYTRTQYVLLEHWEIEHPRRLARSRERKFKRPFINPIESAPVDGDWITVYSVNERHIVQWRDRTYDGSPYGTSGFSYNNGYYCAITDYEGWTYTTDEDWNLYAS